MGRLTSQLDDPQSNVFGLYIQARVTFVLGLDRGAKNALLSPCLPILIPFIFFNFFISLPPSSSTRKRGFTLGDLVDKPQAVITGVFP